MKYFLLASAVCALAITGCTAASQQGSGPHLPPSHHTPPTHHASAQPKGSWVLTKMAGYRVAPGVQTTLDIGPGGKVTGSSGCNRYFGKMMMRGNNLQFGPLGATQMACPGKGMQQEANFFKNTRKVSGWHYEGNTLVMTDSRGKTVLSFKKQ